MLDDGVIVANVATDLPPDQEERFHRTAEIRAILLGHLGVQAEAAA